MSSSIDKVLSITKSNYLFMYIFHVAELLSLQIFLTVAIDAAAFCLLANFLPND